MCSSKVQQVQKQKYVLTPAGKILGWKFSFCQ